MQTRSSSRLTSDQSSNPTSSTNTTRKGRNSRSSKQKVENSNLKEHLPLVVAMTDNRTMAKLLRAPTEGYAEAIMVPLIVAKDVPDSVIKLILFPFSLTEAARRWLEKEPPCSIHTWEDLVSKFINEFFPPSRTTNLCNEILNFQQRFDESFHEAWDRYKDLLRVCPHHGFTELHHLDTFYNALNPADQDSFNAAAGGNLWERSTQDALTIIKNKSKVRNSRSKPIASQVKDCDVNSNSSEIAKLTHAVNQQTNAVTTAMTAILKQFQANPPPAPVKAFEETCVTCEGAHPYYQWLSAGGNTFPEFRDNIQGYVSVAAVNYNQGNLGHRPPEGYKEGCSNELQPERRRFLNSFTLTHSSAPLSSSRLTSDQSSNPTSSTNTTRKGRNRRSSKQKVENSNLEEHLPPVVVMADNRTMAELLRAPTEGYAKAIVVPSIVAKQFKLKHSLINMMTTDQFFGFKNDNPHDHIRWFNEITSTIKYRDVPNSMIKLILFPFYLAKAARRWLEKEPPRSIHTWEDLVSKFIMNSSPLKNYKPL
nr:reverse transcriptase domain-containing protein [Tanacetum cinerariifolium]